MERLTRQGELGPYWDKCVFSKHGGMEEDLIIDRLAHYEDLAEQGRLVELPCKVGSPVYWIDIRWDRVMIVCKPFRLTDAEETKKMWGKLVHPTKESAVLCLKENGYDDYFDVSHFPVHMRRAEAALAASGKEG